MIYEIQHRIETLTRNAVGLLSGNQAPSFVSLEISFSHWDFNWADSWKQDYWLASSNIEAPNIDAAYREFSAKLSKIVPKIALISQCYVQQLAQPFLVHRADSEIAFVKYVSDVKGVGLMFQEQHLNGLNMLLDNSEIPEEFYYYWNDAVNTVGYSAKLLLMFSAIEALVKIRTGKNKGKKDRDKLELILGPELKADLWGVIGNTEDALRNRLVHGEYFNPGDSGKDYLELTHQKIIRYFNEHVFREKLIHEDIVRPQRNFSGNKEEGRFFIRPKIGQPLNLKEFLLEVKNSDLYQLRSYEFVYDDALTADY